MAYTGPFPFTNTKTITAISVSHTSFSGNVANTGKIEAPGQPESITVTDSTIDGEIIDSGYIGFGISLDGNSKLIDASGTGIRVSGLSFLGGITNAGMISEALGINIAYGTTFSGGIGNGGTITAQFTGINVQFETTFSGGIANSGTIFAETGIYLDGVANFSGNIANSGSIAATIGIRIVNSTINGGIFAGGDVAGGISLDINSKLTNSGATGTGVLVDGSTFSGGITNAGAISAKDTGLRVKGTTKFTGGIANSGTIASSILAGVDVFEVSSFSGGISNGGTITAHFTGINVQADATFTGGVRNSGKIASGLAGIQIFGITPTSAAVGSTTFSGGIGNSGTISAGGQGIFVYNGSTFSGGISNGGTITSAEDGIEVELVSVFSGGVSNSGTIANSLGTGILLFGGSFSGGISNSGTISAAANGIKIENTAGIIVFDSGAISAGGGTAIDFANAGTGVVNTLTLGSGYSITGKVIGAGGDIFQLGGSSGGSFNLGNIGTQYTGFTTFDVDGATWVLTGTGSENWTIDAGTLELGSGGKITDNVTFVGSAATLQLDTGTSQIGGDIAGDVTGDDIDLRFQAFASGDHAVWSQGAGSGTLSLVSGGGTTLASLDLAGAYGPQQFTAASDNNGGTLIQVVAQPPNPPPPAGTTAAMIMRDGSNGDYEIYDLGSNAILAAGYLGQVGLEWQVAGVGAFDGPTPGHDPAQQQ